jgi:hypothetical protein
MSGAQVASLVSAVIVAVVRGCNESELDIPDGGTASTDGGTASTDGGASIAEVVPTTSLPGVRDRLGIADARGRLYVIGGRLDPVLGNTRAEVFSAAIAPAPDGHLGEWQQTTPLPVPRLAHAVVTDGRSLYVVGGCPQFCTDGEFQEMKRVFRGTLADDGSVAAWEESAPLPEPRFLHTAVAHGGFLYVLGGTFTTTTTWKARIGSDGRLGPWTQDRPLHKPQKQHASLVVGQHLYAGGGNQQIPDVTWWTDIEVSTIQPDGSLGAWTTIPGAQSLLEGDLAEYAWANETGLARTSYAAPLPVSGERTQHVVEDRIYQIYRFQGSGPQPSVPDATPVVFIRFH